jgi:hypothetical protein
VTHPSTVLPISASAHVIGTSCAIMMIRRRSKLSATAPPTSVNARTGTNWHDADEPEVKRRVS